MSGVGDVAPWSASAIASLLAFAGAVASHVRLAAAQRSDRELIEEKLKAETAAREAALRLIQVQLSAETAAREAADLLADERLKGWSERLKQVQAEQERTKDMAEKVGRLAQAVESLAERVTAGQDRTDERFEALHRALEMERGR